ncbi:hypothetical protein Cfor_01065 [Coptotermes formosanus]|uniref:U4/U6.U5 small nuclear ribonucleoprotein 27 kDa protein n=1 Tax=Coptotermes formosanus TaxID=36987 RepID=A0A6L2PQY5_COPFO|nr:hypothetical protein Cfor_01065 [Coptotermes formosanus]
MQLIQTEWADDHALTCHAELMCLNFSLRKGSSHQKQNEFIKFRLLLSQKSFQTNTDPYADLEGKSPDEQEMMKLMGFCSFDTTKGKKVAGNEVGTVHVILKRKYRQYMNRKGGFNRPLDFVA